MTGLGGHTLGSNVRRALGMLMTQEVAMEFSWLGQKGKRRFVDLQLADIIFSKIIKSQYSVAQYSNLFK